MRIAPIIPGTKPELAEQEAQIISQRGRISELYQVLLNSPPIAHGWEQMLSAVRNKSSISADVRELCILRVAVLNNAPFEFNAHAPIALREGVPQALIEAVRETEIPINCTPIQNIALQLSDAMTRDIVVPDALFEEVKKLFNPQQQIDLVATIAAYNMVSRFLTAFQIGH
jgi:4-carboxymuconolactone decarboxylase